MVKMINGKEKQQSRFIYTGRDLTSHNLNVTAIPHDALHTNKIENEHIKERKGESTSCK